LNSFDSNDLACGGQHEEHAARFAFVIGVHTRVRLLIPLVLKVLVLAIGHWYRPVDECILAFGGSLVPGVIVA